MLFDAVKRSVTTRQAAEHYQLRVDRKGLVACPFHNDRTPSMKVDARFHCFGCGADGDVIDFTARLHGLDVKAAAEKLAADFHVPYEDAGHKLEPKRPVRNEEKLYRQLEDRCFRVLSDYLLLLRQWATDYAPQPEDEIWHPRFVEALQKKTYIEYLLDVLLYHEALGRFEEPKTWEIREINEIMNQSVTGWTAYPNPRSYRKYGKQRGCIRGNKVCL